MKISRNSWHYRIVNKIFDYPSKSLCLYFWQIPTAAVAIVVIGLFMAAVALCAVGSLLFILSQPVYLALASSVSLIDAIMLGTLSVAVWCGVLKEIHKHLAYSSYDKVLFSLKEIDKKPKKPNLLFEYLKARKEKICPTIEFHYGD